MGKNNCSKPIIYVILLGILCSLCFLIIKSYKQYKQREPHRQREGFSPKWLRTEKNKLMKQIRRTVKPYIKTFKQRIKRIKRKWL